MIVECGAVAVAELVQQPRRALDVREEKGHHSTRELAGHVAMISPGSGHVQCGSCAAAQAVRLPAQLATSCWLGPDVVQSRLAAFASVEILRGFDSRRLHLDGDAKGSGSVRALHRFSSRCSFRLRDCRLTLLAGRTGWADDPAVRLDLPTGTVTFLFTDVEGSTWLLNELGAEAYAHALADHRAVIREACLRTRGSRSTRRATPSSSPSPYRPGCPRGRVRVQSPGRDRADPRARRSPHGHAAARPRRGTSASTSIARRGSRPPGTAGRCSLSQATADLGRRSMCATSACTG